VNQCSDKCPLLKAGGGIVTRKIEGMKGDGGGGEMEVKEKEM
jgi:hypothetical protein